VCLDLRGLTKIEPHRAPLFARQAAFSLVAQFLVQARADFVVGQQTKAHPAIERLVPRHVTEGGQRCRGKPSRDGPCQRFGLYLESLTAKKKTPHMILKDAGAAGFSPNGSQIVFSAGGGLVVRSLATGALRSIETPNLTPTTGAPPTWR